MTMPSSSRPTRSVVFDAHDFVFNACAGLCSFGPPRQTANHERPPEMTSARPLLRQHAPGGDAKRSHTADGELHFYVIAASAERSAMDSSCGLASRLSPTQTALKAPESSPRFVMSKKFRNRHRADNHAAIG
mgnify:CR=1 FL=1